MSTAKGRSGEAHAAAFLQRRGFTILEHNVRLGRGELDLIARRDDLLLFVEVKFHRQRESSLLAVHPEKCARLRSAAEAWLAHHPEYANLQCRFDLMIVTPRVGLPAWIPPGIEQMEDIIR